MLSKDLILRMIIIISLGTSNAAKAIHVPIRGIPHCIIIGLSNEGEIRLLQFDVPSHSLQRREKYRPLLGEVFLTIAVVGKFFFLFSLLIWEFENLAKEHEELFY